MLEGCDWAIPLGVTLLVQILGWFVVHRKNLGIEAKRFHTQLSLEAARGAIELAAAVRDAAFGLHSWCLELVVGLRVETALLEQGLSVRPASRVWDDQNEPPAQQLLRKREELTDALARFGYYFEAHETILFELRRAKQALLEQATGMPLPSDLIAVISVIHFNRASGAITSKSELDKLEQLAEAVKEQTLDLLACFMDLITMLQNEFLGRVFKRKLPIRQASKGKMLTRDGVIEATGEAIGPGQRKHARPTFRGRFSV